MEYWQHPTYGKENRTHKLIIVTLNNITKQNWYDLQEKELTPSLNDEFNTQFSDLEYINGDMTDDGMYDDWEKTDTSPRGVIGYDLTNNQIKIWASEAITPEYFVRFAKAVFTVVTKAPVFDTVDVGGTVAVGISVQSAGTTLAETAQSLELIPSATPTPKPGKRPTP